jgi:heme/copper-type cytochrome/quinol oxidase subunit 2
MEQLHQQNFNSQQIDYSKLNTDLHLEFEKITFALYLVLYVLVGLVFLFLLFMVAYFVNKYYSRTYEKDVPLLPKNNGDPITKD